MVEIMVEMNVIRKIRDTISEVLRTGQAEVAIGYEAGTLPLTARPVLIKDAARAGSLVFPPFRNGGTALYVRRFIEERRKDRNFDPAAAKKIAVVARPCDVKAIVNYIKEKQFNRDDVFIIGVNCPGVVSRAKVYEHTGPYEIASASVENGHLTVKKQSGEEVRLPAGQLIADTCARCVHRSPVTADIIVGDEVTPPDTDPFAVVKKHEEKSADEKWEWFSGQMERCIRCRACRQACPMCYCKTCFADQTNPAWVGQTAAPADVMGFHIGRLFHMAGRCVNCGECDAACPVNIPLTVMNRKLDQVIHDLYNFRSGAVLEDDPPLSVYKPDDSDEGFM